MKIAIAQINTTIGDFYGNAEKINSEKALFQNADEEFHVKVAHNLDEACKLLEVCFEYVTDINGAKLFRQRK